MKHAREDYNRIQDPALLIPENEPVFLLRGTDITAAATVRYWADRAEASGASAEIVSLARAQADRMDEWVPKHIPTLPGEDSPAQPASEEDGGQLREHADPK